MGNGVRKPVVSRPIIPLDGWGLIDELPLKRAIGETIEIDRKLGDFIDVGRAGPTHVRT